MKKLLAILNSLWDRRMGIKATIPIEGHTAPVPFVQKCSRSEGQYVIAKMGAISPP